MGWWWAGAAPAAPAACRRSPGGPGGSGRPGRGPRPRAGPPAPGLESRTLSQREPRPEPAAHCSWPWRGASRPGEAGY